ncbi:uncharacterized protein EV154DRAFT_589182 [Mucor mucedo]|uniref:uncharacterized protein n=1 Tax=Mucor mucedo TaxID=29922 RepID=UPI002220E9E6|nr:uncharacterized protein EV154DRAFT_589182 [Mucor mucedo]KAI7890911.1 hypothetical protein EV154DRAFT_589182 [Mucor mucedo]
MTVFDLLFAVNKGSLNFQILRKDSMATLVDKISNQKLNDMKLHQVIRLLLMIYIGLIKETVSKVTIVDESIPFSPRLYGRSAVTYNNKMYVYGGRYVAVVGHSSDMYEYNFDTPNGETATVSLVKQINQGPSCSFCGAVMIDDSHMMILSHKFADYSTGSTKSRTVVRPYIFDFVSLTWTEKEVPTYNQTDESAFYMRARHGTVLGKDGMIYVIGGTNFYEDRNPLTTSYFYDPVYNYYGIIDNNGFDYKTIGPSTFNLPRMICFDRDGNIGSVFGRIGANIDTEDYNSHMTMMVLDTKIKTWIKNQTLSLSPSDDILLNQEYDEGVTVQLVPNTNFAIFFGTKLNTKSLYNVGNEANPKVLKRLNLVTNAWDIIQAKNYRHSQYENIYASSAIISNGYMVFAFGTYNYYKDSGVYKDVNIFELLYQNLDNENTSSHNLSLNWVPTISQYEGPFVSETDPIIHVFPSVILFAVLICAIAIIAIIMYMLVNRKTICFKGKRTCSFQRIIGIFCSRRAGETFSTQIYGLVTNLIFFLLFMLFIAYFAYNIINSSVSSTEEILETNDVPFPDIRICYSGWYYYGYNDTNGVFPYLDCLPSSNPSDVNYCEDVYKLPRSIVSPNFLEGETICYMYAPPIDRLNYIHEGAYLNFRHSGGVSDSVEQSIHIQIYEPTKNPNRVVFDISPFPRQYSAEYLDDWIDFQLNNSFIHGTAGQKITLNGLSSVNIHFKITYTQKIDPDSLWNLVGVFPNYIQISELSITNSEVFGNQNAGYKTKFMELYPLDQQKTVVTEKRDVTIMSTLGILGGIASMLIALRVFLFGARPAKPWGIFQRLSFKSRWEQSKSKNLNKFFRIPGVENVPFVTPVHERFSNIHTVNEDHSLTAGRSRSLNGERERFLSEQSASGTQIDSFSIHNSIEKDKNSELSNSDYNMQERLEQIEARNQILELVLKAYYMDDRVFREIHENIKKEAHAERTSSSEEVSNEEKQV